MNRKGIVDIMSNDEVKNGSMYWTDQYTDVDISAMYVSDVCDMCDGKHQRSYAHLGGKPSIEDFSKDLYEIASEGETEYQDIFSRGLKWLDNEYKAEGSTPDGFNQILLSKSMSEYVAWCDAKLVTKSIDFSKDVVVSSTPSESDKPKLNRRILDCDFDESIDSSLELD